MARAVAAPKTLPPPVQYTPALAPHNPNSTTPVPPRNGCTPPPSEYHSQHACRVPAASIPSEGAYGEPLTNAWKSRVLSSGQGEEGGEPGIEWRSVHIQTTVPTVFARSQRTPYPQTERVWGGRRGRPVRIPSPLPSRPPQSFRTRLSPICDFGGKGRRQRRRKKNFALPEGFFIYPMCLCSRYSEFCGECKNV